MPDESQPSGTRGARTWRSIVINADPDYIVNSEKLPEYEFKGAGKTRTFEGWYKRRGAYSDA